jgi:hypothetical protein
VQGSTTEYLSLTPAAQGNYAVTVTAKINGTAVASASTTVACVAREGTYKWRVTGDSSYKAARTAFGLAPGQFTETPKSTDPNATLLGAGGFDGYSIFAFDHSIERQRVDGVELYIRGNAFSGWSEPGTVWVMQDENGNGKPDDTWYELIGARTLRPETLRRYSVTYRRDGSWISNVGGSGTIGPLMRYRSTADWETYTNTRLVDDAWYIGATWKGYADCSSRFSIGNAIQVDGSAIDLAYIDFVRVATAVHYYHSAFGEISSEYNLPLDNTMTNSELIWEGLEMGYKSYRYELINNSGYVLTITLGNMSPFNLNRAEPMGQ